MGKRWCFLLVALALFLATASIALADEGVFGDEGYNWEDPIFWVAGTQVEVRIVSEVPEGETVSRPTRVFLLVPRNVEASVEDDGGLRVRLVPMRWYRGGDVPVRALVFKPRTDQGSRYPVAVTVKAGDEEFPAEGTSGRTISVQAWVPAP
ncbi:MAG: hypothetical protein H5T59_01535 [Anaerolineae bacterium]|nr:hypothetical protein [Anaerolineae bacterium]